MVCFERAVREAGASDFHFQDLRHTFAARLRAANVHEYDIADLLGHPTPPGETRSTKVTRGYAHVGVALFYGFSVGLSLSTLL